VCETVSYAAILPICARISYTSTVPNIRQVNHAVNDRAKQSPTVWYKLFMGWLQWVHTGCPTCGYLFSLTLTKWRLYMQHIITEIQNGSQLATVSRINPQTEKLLPLIVIHNQRRLAENHLKTLCVSLQTDQWCKHYVTGRGHYLKTLTDRH